MKQQKLLMVEDSLSMAAVYKAYLKDTDYSVRIVTNLEGAREECQRLLPDIVMLDVELPDGSGLDLLHELQTTDDSIEVIIMTAHGSSDMAVKAIDDGAFDFLTKPFDKARLMVTLDNAGQHQELARRVEAYSSFDRDRYCNFIGKSLPMQAVYRVIDSLAASTATAFIIGESGTGKELAAEAIHSRSARADRSFHALNCGAIPTELMESELFGHTKGAFTGATSDREGAAAVANGGTLFLDEICEMDLELQKKLLRFLQTGTYQKVGSNKLETVDIRFVCATNKDPLTEVRAGRFREDLYYRLHVVPLQLPPLRARDEDIELLARFFLEQFSQRDGKEFSGYSADARAAMNAYSWPGNVRELQNAVQNIVVLNSGKKVERSMLPPSVLGIAAQPMTTAFSADNYPRNQLGSQSGNQLGSQPDNYLADQSGSHSGHYQQSAEISSQMGGSPAGAAAAPSGATANTVEQIQPLWMAEKQIIERAIDLCGGSINRAAGRLEVAPSTLYRKIQSWST